MTTEAFSPGDIVEAIGIDGKVLGRGTVVHISIDGWILVIEFEETIPGTNRRTDSVLAENCRKVGERKS